MLIRRAVTRLLTISQIQLDATVVIYIYSVEVELTT